MYPLWLLAVFVSAAQRWVSSPPGAADGISPLGLLQASKHPSLQASERPFGRREIVGWGARKESVRLREVDLSMIYLSMKIS